MVCAEVELLEQCLHAALAFTRQRYLANLLLVASEKVFWNGDLAVIPPVPLVQPKIFGLDRAPCDFAHTCLTAGTSPTARSDGRRPGCAVASRVASTAEEFRPKVFEQIDFMKGVRPTKTR